MTSKEKAKELTEKYDVSLYNTSLNVKKITLMNAKRHALICVDEILLDHITADPDEQSYYYMGCRKYWNEVKTEIKRL